MVIAMGAVGVVKVAVHQIVHVVTVRHGFVAATRAVHVCSFMSIANVARSACARVRRRHRNHVFVHMIAVRVMQVAIMEVVNVVVVANGHVAAACAVLVVVVRVGCCIAGRHGMLREVRK